jgi:pimeloyl-ACP methyl ester carboxylesterase
MKLALRMVAALVVLAVLGGLLFYLNPLWFSDQQIRFRLWREGVRSEYVMVDGYRIHYFEALPPKGVGGVPLVLVHGLGARGEDWGEMIPAMAAHGFHVYVPDLLGFGRSPKPDVSYSIAMQETLVVQFMQTMHITRADVGGWSMGGWVSMKLALDHPEMVDRLMVYDSAGIYFPATFGPELFTPGDLAGARKLLGILTPKPVNLPDFVGRALLRRLKANAWVMNRTTTSMLSGRDLLDFRLHELQQPLLIVWGAQDELIPLASGEEIHRSVPQSVLVVVQGCGHLAPAECSKPVIESTFDFLKADPPMPRGERMYPAGH